MERANSAVADHVDASKSASTGNEVESKLIPVWQQLLNVSSISVDQDYFDLGGDSSLAVQMFAQIENIFSIKLPLATLYEAPTIAQLAGILRREVSDSRWSPLVAIQPNGTRPPFFCFHGAGGNVLSYRELSVHLGNDQPVYGLQCQGLDGDSPLLTRIEDMVTLYIRAIRKVQPNGPYFLGGYCMGGTVAYEAAQQFQAQGEQVALLALFDTMNWNKIPLTFLSKSSYWCQRLWFHAASFFQLDSAGKRDFLREKWSVLRNRIPVWKGRLLAELGKRPGADVADSLLLAKVWHTNDVASWAYLPQPFRGKLTDFRPMKQYRVFSQPGVKWDQLAQGGQETIVLPVYPATMMVEPFVKELARALKQAMDSAILGQPSSSRIS
jgi:thioesterase domain-containing protein/acyl carrier protein